MSNNKGFTLVELLAVIVVLALIIGIAVPNAISLSNKSKRKMYYSKVDMMIKAAQLYGEDHPNIVSGSDTCSDGKGIVTIDTLVADGKVKKDNDKAGKPAVEDPVSNKEMGGLKLCVYKDNNRVYASLTSCKRKKGVVQWSENGVDVSEYCENLIDTYDTSYESAAVGDYVRFTANSATSVSVLGSSTINPSTINTWRIIKVNDNGTFDVVAHIPTNPVMIYLSNPSDYSSLNNKLADAFRGNSYVKNVRMPNQTDFNLINTTYGNANSARYYLATGLEKSGYCPTSNYSGPVCQAMWQTRFALGTGYSMVLLLVENYNYTYSCSGQGSNCTYRFSNVTRSSSVPSVGIRPVLTINLSTDNPSGSGTLDSPYILQ